MRQTVMDFLVIHPAFQDASPNDENEDAFFAGPSAGSNKASAYLPWIEMLRKNNVHFSSLCLAGYDPFFHEDLEGFLCALRLKLPRRKFSIYTNGFWLSMPDIHANLVTLTLIDRLYVTPRRFYPCRSGAMQHSFEVLQSLASLHPHLQVLMPGRRAFRAIDDSGDVDSPLESPRLGGARLRSDGRLERRLDPLEPPGLRAAHGEAFDLARGVDGLHAWLRLAPAPKCTPSGERRHDAAAVESLPEARLRRERERDYHVRAARRLLAAGRLDLAEGKLLRVLKRHPKCKEAHTVLGETLRRQREPAAAVRCFERALTLDPHYEPALEHLAKMVDVRAER